MQDMSTMERVDSPDALDLRQPMMTDNSRAAYPTGHNGVQHESEEYHSGYARTPTSVV